MEVKIGDAHVEGSPFLLKAYDSTKVKVTDVTSGVVGKPVYFSSKHISTPTTQPVYIINFYYSQR